MLAASMRAHGANAGLRAVCAARRRGAKPPEAVDSGMYGKDVEMPDGNASVILYDPSDDNLSQALLRCSDLAGFICQVLYPGSDPTGHDAGPKLRHVDPPPTLLWWLCSLRVTLESLAISFGFIREPNDHFHLIWL